MGGRGSGRRGLTVTMAECACGSFVRCQAAGDVLRSSTESRRSRAGSATASGTGVNEPEKPFVIQFLLTHQTVMLITAIRRTQEAK